MATNYSTIQEVTTSFYSNNTANAFIVLKAEESLIQLSWKNSPTPAELAECADFLSTLIIEHNVHQILHDVRNVNYITIDMHRCLAKVFCPKLMEAGISKMVHLANYAVPDLMVIDQITDYVKQKFAIDGNTSFEICTTPEGAMEWFKNVSIKKSTLKTVSTPIGENVAEPVACAINQVSQLDSIIKTYKEKASLIFRILFKRKALFADL